MYLDLTKIYTTALFCELAKEKIYLISKYIPCRPDFRITSTFQNWVGPVTKKGFFGPKVTFKAMHKEAMLFLQGSVQLEHMSITLKFQEK